MQMQGLGKCNRCGGEYRGLAQIRAFHPSWPWPILPHPLGLCMKTIGLPMMMSMAFPSPSPLPYCSYCTLSHPGLPFLTHWGCA